MPDIIPFLQENGITVFVEVHRTAGVLRTERLGELAEPYLYQRLIEYTDGEGLYQVGGGHFPYQMFNQGDVWCMLSRFEPDRVMALFYNSGEDALANHRRVIELDEKLRAFMAQ